MFGMYLTRLHFLGPLGCILSNIPLKMVCYLAQGSDLEFRIITAVAVESLLSFRT